MTQELFETLISEFDIFPRFREFILLFGAKHAENEIGPPQMRFRRLAIQNSQSVRWEWAGFGNGTFRSNDDIADLFRMRIRLAIRGS